jgi:hypothetical protein
MANYFGRDFPVEGLISRAVPQILPLGLAIVMLLRGNGVRKRTLATLSGSASGGPLYWANAASAATPAGRPWRVGAYRSPNGFWMTAFSFN